MASKNDDDNDLLEEDKKEDRILDCAIHYILNKTYPCELEKDKKRAVRKRAATLVLEDGEVFVQQKNRKVKVIRNREDQLLSVQACHSDPTSGHFGMKTWRRSTYFVLYECCYCTLLRGVQIFCTKKVPGGTNFYRSVAKCFAGVHRYSATDSSG